MTIKKILLLITGVATLFLLALPGTASAASHMRTPINYLKSSETTPYPDINKLKDPWIKVSIAKTGSTSWMVTGVSTLCTPAPASMKASMANALVLRRPEPLPFKTTGVRASTMPRSSVALTTMSPGMITGPTSFTVFQPIRTVTTSSRRRPS